MKSFVCLIAVACAVSIVSADTWDVRKFFPVNKHGPYISHSELMAKLNEKALTPEQTIYLVSSCNPDETSKLLIGDWPSFVFVQSFNEVIKKYECDYGLEYTKEDVKSFAKLDDGSVLFDNLNRFLQVSLKKILEYCSEK